VEQTEWAVEQIQKKKMMEWRHMSRSRRKTEMLENRIEIDTLTAH
jgi:hypothetical protein